MSATTLATTRRRLDALAVQFARPAADVVPRDAIALAGRLGLTLDDWQRDALQSTAPQVMLNVTRQGGKSTVAALLGLSTALARPNALVLAVSPGERQSKLLFRTMLKMYRDLGRPVPATVENKLSLELANGSEIVALPGSESTIRGHAAVSLLLVDEASRVPDELLAAVRPMLAISAGRLVTMSTPWGRRGWWHEAWANGGDAWQRFEIPATACPRIAPAFLEQERRSLGDFWFKQEYLCQFLDSESSAFTLADVQAAFRPGVEQWDV